MAILPTFTNNPSNTTVRTVPNLEAGQLNIINSLQLTFPNLDYMLGSSYSNALSLADDGHLNNNGNIMWSKQYSISSSIVNTKREDFNEIILLSDGNIINVGQNNSNSGSNDIWLVKTDTIGNVIWSKTYGGTSEDIGVNVREKTNGELVISALTGSFGGANDLLLINTDALGNVIWSKKYGGNVNDELDWWGKPMSLNASDEIILVGGTSSFGDGNEDVYIIKTNECGDSFCNEQNVVLSVTSPNVLRANFSISSVSGGVLVNTTSTVTSINYTETFLCVDTLIDEVSCDLIANFSSNSNCIGDSAYFNDLSNDNLENIMNWQWYFGDGDSIVGDQNPAHLYNASGNYSVRLVVINDSNCVDSITIPITINPIYTSTQTESICEGDSILLEGKYQHVAGNYVDFFASFNGCDSLVNTVLGIEYPPDVVAFLDTTIDKGSFVQLSAIGAESYLWKSNYELDCNNCQNPIVYPQITTRYIVQGNYGNCSAFDTVTVTVNELEQYLYVPNSFSPNNDGDNDVFRIYGQAIEDFKILIYNRWGELLFESNNIGNSWRGIYKGAEIPSGIYIYKVKIGFSNSKNIEKFGHINLIR
jgi:gliding motility-associated-like protein